MGLLDDVSPADQAILSLGLGLLSSRGPFNQALGQAGLGAMNVYNQAQDSQLARKVKSAQLGQIEQETALNAAKVAQMQRTQQIIDQAFGSMNGQGQQPQPSAIPSPYSIGGQQGAFDNGSGIRMGGMVQSAPQQQSAGFGLTLPQVSALKLAGVDLFPEYKYAADGIERKPGSFYQNPITGQREYIADPTKGLNVGPDGTVSVMPGFADASAAIAGATTRAQKAAEAAYTPEKVFNEQTGRYEFVPRSTLLSPSTGNDAPAPLRNNNPGALSPGGKIASFDTPEAGLAALDKNLANYGLKGLNTVRSVISTWAPPTDANGNKINDTDSYIKDVSQRLGISPDAQINLSNPVQRQAVATAIMLHENGPSALFGGGKQSAGVAAEPSLATQAKFGAQKTAAETAAKNASDYENSLNERVRAGAELVQRIAEQQKTLDSFRTGATGEARAKMAAYARDLGAPEDLVQRIGGGDPAAAQEFQKFAAQTNLEQLKQAIGSNRMLKTEFDAFQQANPSINSDPQAIRKVFDWLRQTYQRDFSEQQSLAAFKKQGGDIADFPAWYSAQRNASLPGLTTPQPSAPPASSPSANGASVQALAAAEIERRKRARAGGATGAW